MKAYADSNFLVRLFLELPESCEADTLATAAFGSGGLLPVTWLHRAETLNAFHLHVWQARQPGQLRVNIEQALLATTKFRDAVSSRMALETTRLAPQDLEARQEGLVLRHTAKQGFRTYDLLHVASALLLGCDTFWSFDEKANRLATLEGLAVRAKRTSSKPGN
jgi:predicted nucleic acid-binding protein